MTAPVNLPSRQLLVFGFDANAAFEGQLVGALERMESGGALRILDVIFVAADEATGELIAIDLQGGTGGLTAKLLDFRLDPAGRRRKGTSELARDLGAALQPGTALAAVLVEHIWSRVLDDAVSRVGGRSLASDFVDASRLSELGADLPARCEVSRHSGSLRAARRSPQGCRAQDGRREGQGQRGVVADGGESPAVERSLHLAPTHRGADEHCGGERCVAGAEHRC